MLTQAIEKDGTSWLGLAGRVCVVTGAGSGIGAETARQLAVAGARVAVIDRNGDAAALVAAEINRAGGRAIAIEADVSQSQAIVAAAEQVQKDLGACEVLINNAALVGYAGPLLTVDTVQWNQGLAVNLTGALVCAQVFTAQMIAAGNGGTIVNVASICGHLPLPHGGAYSVSKSGLMMLTRMLALELAEHRIRCNSVSPGYVRTPATAAAYSEAVIAEGRRRMIPSGRIGEPEDLANVIMFAASDRAAYLNGEDILVDGGVHHALLAIIPKQASPMPSTGR